MLYDQLLHYQIHISKLKSLPEDSKEYKKLYSDLSLVLGRYAIQDIKNAKKGDSLYSFKKEYYLRVLIFSSLLLFAFLIIALIITFFGDVDTSPNENIMICALLIISMLLSLIAFIVSLSIPPLIDNYLHSAINRFWDENCTREEL